eukprot:PhF_6_TR27012/c0_g1_i2/m.39448/K08968/msrC; L-methionine (R)-S-oxide reductase
MSLPKVELYAQLQEEVRTQLGKSPEGDYVSALANVSAAIYHKLNHGHELPFPVNWVGFYLMRGDALILGPFQGKPACVTIALGKGVCGTSALTRRTILVKDVHNFPGHIACDPDSNSEIVVPIKIDATPAARVVAVLDLDSRVIGHFNEEDQKGLFAISQLITAAGLKWPEYVPSTHSKAMPPNQDAPHLTKTVMTRFPTPAVNPTNNNISLHGWNVVSSRMDRIASSDAVARVEETLGGIHLMPEILFDATNAELCFPAKHLSLQFSALGALRNAKHYYTTPEYALVKDSLKVQYAASWKKKGVRGDSSEFEAGIDWAFRNTYSGDLTINSHSVDITSHPTETQKINYDMLKKTDEKIVLYDVLDLFEDELHDCGSSKLSVRYRVMNTCFLFLLRHALRVDNVTFRLQDTRWFHDFSTSQLICEVSMREIALPLPEELLQHLKNPDALADKMTVVATKNYAISLE